MFRAFDRKLNHFFPLFRGPVAFRPGNLAFSFLLAAILSSCSSTVLLPRQQKIVITPWNSFMEAKNAFDRITPYRTKKNELAELGFAPPVTPNFKILNYLDIMEQFMPSQSITIEDLPPGLQDCLGDKEECVAYEINVHDFDAQRFGNVFLDLFNFRRKTTVKGWDFNAIIVIKGDLVVYKLSSGTPKTNEFHDVKNPLGPLQSSDRFLWTVVR